MAYRNRFVGVRTGTESSCGGCASAIAAHVGCWLGEDLAHHQREEANWPRDRRVGLVRACGRHKFHCQAERIGTWPVLFVDGGDLSLRRTQAGIWRRRAE